VPWPPPLSARWTSLALFLFAMMLHLFAALGGQMMGMDFKFLIIVDEIGAILLAALLFAMLLGVPIRDAFLLRSAHWKHYAAALAAAIPLQLFGGAMQEIVLELMPGGDAWRQLLEDTLGPLLRGNTTGDMLVLLLGAVVLAAVCEEVLFRGVLLQLLARGGRWRSAILVSAVLFAVFHLDFIGLLPRTLLGIYFGILVWRSGSIFPAMLAHAANNGLAFALAPLADLNAPTPTLFEATLLGLVTGTVFVAILVAYLRFTPAPAPPSAAPVPTDTATPPDSTHHTDPHES
jgi:membrane protease YdiL (CAAX protease family)